MQNRVQSGRNTKNDRHAHLLGIANPNPKNYMDLDSRTTWESDIFTTFHFLVPPLFRFPDFLDFRFLVSTSVSCLPADEATAKLDHNLSNQFGQQTAK